jgi:hypothetical protein
VNQTTTLDPKQMNEVRTQVRALLEKSDAYKEMDPEKRKKLAHDLVNVVGYLADPRAAQPVSSAMLDQPGQQKNAVNTAQTGFTAPAAQAGAEAMKAEMEAINFPQFVSSLIQGVFMSIVDASIRQMEAYQKLLESVVKSVNEYANEHVTPNQARDYLASRYPEHLEVNTEGEQPKLDVKSDADQATAPDFKKDFGLTKAPDVSDEEGEKMLVQAAQLQMARMRQQQLSTMVLLGINRIVVTDGLINAKVIIDVKTKDVAQRVEERKKTATYHDQYKRSDSGGWFSGSSSSFESNYDVTVNSARTDTSTSDVETKAKLTGEVRVNFKSETFPLDRMATPGQMGDINTKAKPG